MYIIKYQYLIKTKEYNIIKYLLFTFKDLYLTINHKFIKVNNVFFIIIM